MELIRKSDAIHAVLHNQGDAAVAAVQEIKAVCVMPDKQMSSICDSIDYDKVLDDLRYDPTDSYDLHDEGADALESAIRNWQYASDMLYLAIRISGLSMTALTKIYDMERKEQTDAEK